MKNAKETLNNLQTINDLKTIREEWERERLACRECGDEQGANYAWIVRSISEVHVMYREMYDLLTQGKYYEAWCHAEQVEILANNIKENGGASYTYVMSIARQIRLLQSIYPYRFFFSTVIDIKEEECSICGTKRSFETWCGHLTGKVYNGELCCNVVTKCEIKSVDLVMNPVHKYAVAFLSNQDGEQRDQYDYLFVKGLMKYWKSPYQWWTFRMEEENKKIVFLMQKQ